MLNNLQQCDMKIHCHTHNIRKMFSQESLVAIVEAVKSAGNLPAAGEDHDFYYSFSDFREFRTAQGARLLSK